MYDKSGTENLRANASIKGPSAHATPNTDGSDVGGRSNLAANETIYVGPRKQTPKGSSDIPAQTFRDHGV